MSLIVFELWEFSSNDADGFIIGGRVDSSEVEKGMALEWL